MRNVGAPAWLRGNPTDAVVIAARPRDVVSGQVSEALFVLTATKLSAATREMRLAAIRLAGATGAQVRALAAIETSLVAVAGCVGGGGGFLLARRGAAGLPAVRSRWFPSDLSVPALAGVAVFVAVPVFAFAVSSGVEGLRRAVRGAPAPHRVACLTPGGRHRAGRPGGGDHHAHGHGGEPAREHGGRDDGASSTDRGAVGAGGPGRRDPPIHHAPDRAAALHRPRVGRRRGSRGHRAVVSGPEGTAAAPSWVDGVDGHRRGGRGLDGHWSTLPHMSKGPWSR